MTRGTRAATCFVLFASIAAMAPLPALADCAAQIVVGKRGDFDLYAYFNRATIASETIPTRPAAAYQCTFEGPYGMVDQPHTLGANQIIKSVGSGWQQNSGAYMCQ